MISFTDRVGLIRKHYSQLCINVHQQTGKPRPCTLLPEHECRNWSAGDRYMRPSELIAVVDNHYCGGYSRV